MYFYQAVWQHILVWIRVKTFRSRSQHLVAAVGSCTSLFCYLIGLSFSVSFDLLLVPKSC
jgi:hypothetical protein